MAKRKMKLRKVKASALCEGFEINIEAVIQPHATLGPDDIIEVQRKLRQKLTMSVASLPFAKIFSHEVRVR